MFSSRAARPEDSEAIARVYNEGIADRVATFETRLRTADDVRAWFDGVHPIVAVEGNGRLSRSLPRLCTARVNATPESPRFRFTSPDRRAGSAQER